MPVGKILDPEGPTAQTTLGTVQDSNGKNYFILNTAKLKKDEPVLFEIHPFDIIIDGEEVKLKIATLERNSEGRPIIGEKPWPKGFKTKWDNEWNGISETRIKEMKIKKNGKDLDKKEILDMREQFQEVIQKN